MFLRTAALVMDDNVLSLIAESVALLEVKINTYFPSIYIKNYNLDYEILPMHLSVTWLIYNSLKKKCSVQLKIIEYCS